MLEKKKRGKRVSKSGVGAERAPIAKNGEKGIQITMIRGQAVGLYVERVGNFRQHEH